MVMAGFIEKMIAEQNGQQVEMLCTTCRGAQARKLATHVYWYPLSITSEHQNQEATRTPLPSGSQDWHF
jgi:hypothetical protein